MWFFHLKNEMSLLNRTCTNQKLNRISALKQAVIVLGAYSSGETPYSIGELVGIMSP